MKRASLLTILVLGTLWGVSEVFLGEALYAARIPHAAVPLNLVALCVLAAARALLPQAGTSTAIGLTAAGYKAAAMYSSFLGSPIFLCHVLGIIATAAAFDMVFSVAPRLNKSIAAIAVAFAGYASFALLITYVFRYGPWVAGGGDKVLRHILVGGGLAAAGGAVLVPLAFKLGDIVRQRGSRLAGSLPRLAPACAWAMTAAMWIIGLIGPGLAAPGR